MNSEPLIFTSKGNLPLSDLTMKHYWEDNLKLTAERVSDQEVRVEKDGDIAYVEEYYLGEELVKRSVAVYKFKGVPIESGKGGFG